MKNGLTILMSDGVATNARLREYAEFVMKEHFDHADRYWISEPDAHLPICRFSIGPHVLLFPETGLHPKLQVATAESIFKHAAEYPVVVCTHSIVMLYALNNASIRAHLEDRALPINALVVAPKTTHNVAITNGFIDEGALGNVPEELYSELNRLSTALQRKRHK